MAELYTYTPIDPFTLTSSWQKVLTVDENTLAVRMSGASDSEYWDIEYTVVPEGDPIPTISNGLALLASEDFSGGIPVGDIYAKSVSGQTLIVWVA